MRLTKGMKWLIHAVCGPMNRQCGLRRTNMVYDLITAALAAAEGESIARARARRRLRCRFQSPAERIFGRQQRRQQLWLIRQQQSQQQIQRGARAVLMRLTLVRCAKR